MKNNVWLVAILSGLVLASGQAAVAGNKAGAVTLTPGLGYDFLASKRHLNNTAVLPQIALAYNLDSRWGLEGTYAALNMQSPAGA